MSQKDFDKFIRKVHALNDLVAFLEESPGKKDQFICCESHEEVVSLAKKWGFDISKQWGES